VDRWEGHMKFMRAMKNAYRILVRKHEGKRLYKDLAVDVRLIVE
jgi:hypothetical protein